MVIGIEKIEDSVWLKWRLHGGQLSKSPTLFPDSCPLGSHLHQSIERHFSYRESCPLGSLIQTIRQRPLPARRAAIFVACHLGSESDAGEIPPWW